MLFNTRRYINFDVARSIFGIDDTFISESVVSSLVINDEVAPSQCSGVSCRKKTAILKAFSESLDRRASLYYKSSKKRFVNGYDIIQQRLYDIPIDLCSYNSKKPRVDTTGTAVHPEPKIAYEKAIYELLQKNSLFLFWYSKIGTLIKNYDKDEILVVEDTFFPVLTVINIKLYKNYFSIGLGTSTNLNDAIRESKNECYLINNIIKKELGTNRLSSDSSLYSFICSSTKEYLFNITQQLPTINKEKYINQLELKDFIIMKPEWLNSLVVYAIPIALKSNLYCYGAYSPQLYLSVPRKTDIDIDRLINKVIVKLDSDKMNEIPNVPFI